MATYLRRTQHTAADVTLPHTQHRLPTLSLRTACFTCYYLSCPASTHHTALRTFTLHAPGCPALHTFRPPTRWHGLFFSSLRGLQRRRTVWATPVPAFGHLTIYYFILILRRDFSLALGVEEGSSRYLWPGACLCRVLQRLQNHHRLSTGISHRAAPGTAVR